MQNSEQQNFHMDTYVATSVSPEVNENLFHSTSSIPLVLCEIIFDFAFVKKTCIGTPTDASDLSTPPVQCGNLAEKCFEINESEDKESVSQAEDYFEFLLTGLYLNFHPVECNIEAKCPKTKFFHGGWRCATCVAEILSCFSPRLAREVPFYPNYDNIIRNH